MGTSPVDVQWYREDGETTYRKIPPVSSWAIHTNKEDNLPAGIVIVVEGPKESLQLIFSAQQVIEFQEDILQLLEEEVAYVAREGRSFPF